MSYFIKQHSLTVNVLISLLLSIVCVVCYLFLILLFLTPQTLHLRSLVFVDDSFLKPTVAVGLLGTVLVGATSALVTRAVEHTLWLRLAPRSSHPQITAKESHRMAQWSVSPLARLFYMLNGQSWFLRCGGVVLFATAVMNPVLLFGIAPKQLSDGSSQTIAPTLDNFAGFLDSSNSQYNGGEFRDNLMAIAALAQMSNPRAPASSLCADSTCRLEALAAGIQATCQSSELDNPDKIGAQDYKSNDSQKFCSDIQPSMCTTLVKSDPCTFANFTTQYPSSCESGCQGEWAVLFGVWVNILADSDAAFSINVVDCQLKFGNMTISQEGSGTPVLSRSSFVPSPYTMASYSSGAVVWHRIYGDGQCSPYEIAAQAGGAGSDSLYEDPVGAFLLNYATGDSAETVARRIEANFDMGTLFAFARAPKAATVTITQTSGESVWHYDARVLLILLLPLLAKLLVLVSCWRVGDDETVIGYDPVEISRRGPIVLGQVRYEHVSPVK